GRGAGLLVAVCCANLAGLLVARGSARGWDLAIRGALGATPWQLVRQLMAESLLLALAGGSLAVLFSVFLTRFLARTFYSVDSEGRFLSLDFRLEAPVVLAVLAASLVAAFLFGLGPAFRAIRLGDAASLAAHSRTASPRSRLGRSLVCIQSAVAVALVTVAGLLVASVRQVAQGAHFEPSRVALLRVRPRLASYPAEKAQVFHRELSRRLEAL